MIQNGNYLVHHGILGQKWGKKNGPPYPLDYNKLSAEEREEAKKSAISRGDVNEANKNRKYYTNQEINQVIDRFNTELRLSQLSEKHVKTGMEKVKELSNTMNTIADAAKKGTDLYNTVVKISNSLGGTNLPTIGDSDGKGKGKNDKESTTISKIFKDGELVKEIVQNSKGSDKRNFTYEYSTAEEKKNKQKEITEAKKLAKEEKKQAKEEKIAQIRQAEADEVARVAKEKADAEAKEARAKAAEEARIARETKEKYQKGLNWATDVVETRAKSLGSYSEALNQVTNSPKVKEAGYTADEIIANSQYIMINGELVKKLKGL